MARTKTRLTKANAKAERWKKAASEQRRAASRSNAEVGKLRRKLDRAAAAAQPGQASEPAKTTASAGAGDTADHGFTVPDQTWTVAQLRNEARARGLVGMSNQPKAKLIAALSAGAGSSG